MALFKCRGCEARDQEITHLMGQLDKMAQMVEKTQARLAEIAEPGIAMRLASGEARATWKPSERPRPVMRREASFPGYGPEPEKPVIEAEIGGEG